MRDLLFEAGPVSLGADPVAFVPAGRAAAAGEDSGISAVLRLEGIDLSFGGVTALSGVDLSIAKGEICAVIGPNGAGKSSLVNVISGLYRPNRGRMWIGGRSFGHVPTARLARLGIARTFQNLALFKGLSVRGPGRRIVRLSWNAPHRRGPARCCRARSAP